MHPLDPVWQSVVREFDQAQALSRHEARHETTKLLNQIVRRLGDCENETDWLDAVLDGLCAFVPQAAVFSAESDSEIRLRGSRHMEVPPNLTFPTSTAAAFADAIASKETVVVLRTAKEVGEDLASETLNSSPGRCYLLPVRNQNRIAALIFVLESFDAKLLANGLSSSPGSQELPCPLTADVNVLEMIASIGSVMLERIPRRTDLVRIAGVPAPAPPRATLPSWADFDEAERSLHIRAQRFARSKVAEMQLYKPELSSRGALCEDLYLYLKPEIDAARQAFQTQFMTVKSMVDYLHLELSSTLAHGNELLLGPDYPGQMV